jgi:hypothetical protein
MSGRLWADRAMALSLVYRVFVSLLTLRGQRFGSD